MLAKSLIIKVLPQLWAMTQKETTEHLFYRPIKQMPADFTEEDQKELEKAYAEIIENRDHPWFVGVQFHPEYKSSVYNPHPIFVNFVKASLKKYLNK